MIDHVQVLRCKALKERACAEMCQDLAHRRRHLETAAISEELADYVGDPSRPAESFWRRLKEIKENKVPHLKLVSS